MSLVSHAELIEYNFWQIIVVTANFVRIDKRTYKQPANMRIGRESRDVAPMCPGAQIYR